MNLHHYEKKMRGYGIHKIKGDPMNKEFYSIADCVRAMGGAVSESRINYAHRNGKVPEPKLRVGGSRIYSKPELLKLSHYFGVTIDSASKGEACSSM